MTIEREKLLRRLRALRWPMFVIVTAAYMFTTFHRLTPAIMGPELMRDIGLDATQFGLVGMAFMWSYAFSQAPAGVLIDRIGARKGLAAILLLATAGCLVFAWAPSFPYVVAGRILIGIAVSGFMVGGTKVVSSWFSAKEYITVYPLFLGLGALGGVFATTPLQWLLSGFGWRHAIVIIGLSGAVLAVLNYWRLRDAPSDACLPSPNELLGESAPEPARSPSAKGASGGSVFKAVFSMPVFWLCGLLSIGVSASGQSLQSLWNGIYLADVFALDKTTIGNVLFCASIGLVLGSIGAGWFMRKIKIAPTLVVSTGGFLVVWIYMTANSGRMTVPELMAVNFLLGFAQMLTIATGFTLIKESVPGAVLGTTMGCLNTVIWVFGAGLFQQLWGFIIKGVSNGVKPYPVEAFAAAFCLQLVTLVIGFLCALAIFRKAGKERGR